MKISGIVKATAIAVAFAVTATASSAAVVLTNDDTNYTGPQLDLSAYANGSYNFTFGPEVLPNGITFTANPGGGGNSGQGSVIGQGSYGLSGNGSFGGDAVYIGVDSGTGYAELAFDTAVSSFGGYWNYAVPQLQNWDAPVISAFDTFGNLLGAFDLAALDPISTPGGFNEFAFRGIVSDTADIAKIRFGGSYILLAGTADGSTPNPVPLPAGIPLLLTAFGGLAFLRRKAKS